MFVIRNFRNIFCLLCCLTTCSLYAQHSWEEFFAINEGTKGIPLCITQDKTGFIWIGTTNGVTRYDGANFTSLENLLSNPENLPEEEIQAIYFDKMGELWLATRNQVYNYTDNLQQVRVYQIDNTIGYSQIRDQWDFKKTNWEPELISRASGKVFRLMRDKKSFITDISRRDKDLTKKSAFHEPSLKFIDRQGNIWLGGSELYLQQKGSAVSENIFQKTKKEFKNVFSIFEDIGNNIWVATDNGIYKFNQSRQRIRFSDLFDQGRITSNICSVGDNFWVTDMSGNLFILDRNLFLIKEIKIGCDKFLKSGPIVTLTTLDNKIYTSITGCGLIEINPKNFSQRTILSEGKMPLIYRVFVSNSRALWLLAEGNRIFKIERGALSEFKVNIPTRIKSIAINKNGEIWIASLAGLFHYTLSGQLIKIYRSDQKGMENFIDEITDLKWQSEKDIIMATPKGIQMLNIYSGRIGKISKRNGLPSNGIISLLPVGSEKIIYTTEREIGLYDILERRNFLLSENRLLKNRTYAFAGIVAVSPTAYLFNSIQGLFILNISGSNSKVPAAPVFSKFAIDGKDKINHSDSLLLPPGKRSLRIDFVSINFNTPGTTYRYRLSGLSDQWVNAGDTKFASYSALNPGSYQFEVQAFTPEGMHSAVSTIQILVEPEFYQTTWFKYGSLLFVLSFTSIIYLFKLKTERKIILVKEEISRDLHDNMGASISSIGILAQLAGRNENKRDQALKKIEVLAERTINDIEHMIWYHKKGKCTISQFSEKIAQLCCEMNPSLSKDYISFSACLNNPEKKISIKLVHEALMIVKEAINNAIKHSRGDEIIVTVNTKGKELEINVSDNGIGLVEKKEQLGSGLLNIQKRAKRIHALVTIESQSMRGTYIKIEVTF